MVSKLLTKLGEVVEEDGEVRDTQPSAPPSSAGHASLSSVRMGTFYEGRREGRSSMNPPNPDGDEDEGW